MNAIIVFSCGVGVGAILMGAIALALREIARLTPDEEAAILAELNGGRSVRYPEGEATELGDVA